MKHMIPKLDYEYSALEPYIDTKTMEIHHTKHHQTYVDKLNNALEKYNNLKTMSVENLLMKIEEIAKKENIPESIKVAIKNNGGGHYNHSLFWKLLKKDVKMSDRMKKIIERDFGSYEEFKKKFSESANSLFGSGWTWLVFNGVQLEILNTPNQDSPISSGKIPVLCIDLWEHSYYLLRQNRRYEWIDAFFNIINWDFVEELYNDAIDGKIFSVKYIL